MTSHASAGDPGTEAPLDAEEPPVELYNEFIAGFELLGIDTVRVAGERRMSGQAPQTHYSLGAGFDVNDDATVRFRYDVLAQLTDEEGKADYGSVEASVILSGRSTIHPDSRCLVRFGRTSGAFMTHPYLRELIATTAIRLGFTGVAMPLITSQPSGNDAED